MHRPSPSPLALPDWKETQVHRQKVNCRVEKVQHWMIWELRAWNRLQSVLVLLLLCRQIALWVSEEAHVENPRAVVFLID